MRCISRCSALGTRRLTGRRANQSRTWLRLVQRWPNVPLVRPNVPLAGRRAHRRRVLYHSVPRLFLWPRLGIARRYTCTQLPETHAIVHHGPHTDVRTPKGHQGMWLVRVDALEQRAGHEIKVLDPRPLAVAKGRKHLQHVHHARLAQGLQEHEAGLDGRRTSFPAARSLRRRRRRSSAAQTEAQARGALCVRRRQQ